MSLWGLWASHHQAPPVFPERWEWVVGRQLTGSARDYNWRHGSLLKRAENGVWESSWGYMPLLDDFMLSFSLVSCVPNPLYKQSGLPWQCVELPGNVMLSIPPSLPCCASTHHEKRTACRFLPTTERGRCCSPSFAFCPTPQLWHCQLTWAWNPLT